MSDWAAVGFLRLAGTDRCRLCGERLDYRRATGEHVFASLPTRTTMWDSTNCDEVGPRGKMRLSCFLCATCVLPMIDLVVSGEPGTIKLVTWREPRVRATGLLKPLLKSSPQLC